MKLSPDQIERIKLEISKSKIYYSDIQEELLDHLCTGIEVKMEIGKNFEQAFEETQFEISPSRFQMQILIATHIGMTKHLFRDMLKPLDLLKSALVCVTWLLIVYFLEDLSPDAASKHIKTLMISVFIGMALISFSRDLLKNSSIVAAGNTLWLTFCIGQFALNMDFLIFLGLSPESALYTITYVLSLIYIAGLSQVTRQYKKLKTT